MKTKQKFLYFLSVERALRLQLANLSVTKIE